MVKLTHELNRKRLDISFCVSTSSVVGYGSHLPCEKKLSNIENKNMYKQKWQSYTEDQIISCNLNSPWLFFHFENRSWHYPPP